MCAKGCVEEPKGKVNKSLAIQTLQSSRLARTNFFAHQWNTESLGLPYSIKYLAIICVNLSKGEGTIFLQQNCYYIGENREGATGRSGTNYIQ